jgi:hypothetical protein
LIDIIASAVKTDWGKIDIDACALSDESVKKERFGDIGFEIDANTIKEE